MNPPIHSYNLSTERLSIEVVPSLGAKLISFRNVVTGREWMWRPRPDAPLFHNKPNDSFDASPLIGADECLPTIAPCRWNGRDLPDHGEAWTRSWEFDQAAFTQGRIRTLVRLRTSSLELERSLSLEGNEAVFEYVLTSRSSQPEQFLWAFHPLIPIEDGDRIELPQEIREVTVASTKGFDIPTANTWSWPAPLPGVHLDSLDFGSHVSAYVKLFADFGQCSDAFVAIRKNREKLSFRFDTLQVPVIGFWFTRGAWNGHTHMAIEPTNAATDSLCAVASNSRTVLQPFHTIGWGFRLVLDTF